MIKKTVLTNICLNQITQTFIHKHHGQLDSLVVITVQGSVLSFASQVVHEVELNYVLKVPVTPRNNNNIKYI